MQERLINDPSNLQPLPKHLNSSKGSKIETGTDGWVKYVKDNKEISPKYRTYLLRQQQQILKDTTEKVHQELFKRRKKS